MELGRPEARRKSRSPRPRRLLDPRVREPARCRLDGPWRARFGRHDSVSAARFTARPLKPSPGLLLLRRRYPLRKITPMTVLVFLVTSAAMSWRRSSTASSAASKPAFTVQGRILGRGSRALRSLRLHRRGPLVPLQSIRIPQEVPTCFALRFAPCSSPSLQALTVVSTAPAVTGSTPRTRSASVRRGARRRRDGRVLGRVDRSDGLRHRRPLRRGRHSRRGQPRLEARRPVEPRGRNARGRRREAVRPRGRRSSPCGTPSSGQTPEGRIGRAAHAERALTSVGFGYSSRAADGSWVMTVSARRRRHQEDAEDLDVV